MQTYPPKPFTILEPENPTSDEFYAGVKIWPTNFEALK